MPDPASSEAMKDFENRFVAALEPDLAVLAFAFTHRGTRDWHFYLNDTSRAQERINDALADLPQLPITLEQRTNPDERDYLDMLGSMSVNEDV